MESELIISWSDSLQNTFDSSPTSPNAPTLLEWFEMLETEFCTIAEKQANLHAFVMSRFEDV